MGTASGGSTAAGGSPTTSGPGSGASSSTGSTSGTGGSEKDGGKDSGGSSTKSTSSTSTGTGGGSTNCTPGTEKECNGKCVAIDDPAYGCTATGCAACATTYPNAMQACVNGTCALGACDTGFKNCDQKDSNGCEANTTNDPTNCGMCGSTCTVPHATASCNNGTCGVGTCDSGWTDCNNDPKDGCEANLQNDPMNCGVCGMTCAGQQECQAGQCGLSCAKGTANCPGDPMDICATMLGTNKNCNFCGDTCALPNATSNCDPNASGTPPYVCDLQQCNAGFANCDMVATNGCEVNTNTDAGNCGSCGNVCPSGPHSTAVCNNGGCGIVCDPGYFDCNNNPSDGCEVNGNTDTNNCGGCGDVCNTPNATPACMGGKCSILTCNSGFSDCDLQVADGCEVNTTTDPKNCGTCGTLCSEQNGTAVCATGLCSLGPCNQGFANCDGKYTTGCNVNVNTDTNNCGGCNNVCNLPNATPTCNTGVCQVASCNSGFSDCDKVASNGCEINTTSSTSNCGSCGNACNTANATPACSNGMCAIASCNPNFGNCDGTVSNGCEINFQTDPNNCGGCGIKCSLPNATAACTNGMCTIAVCTAGFADCDKNPTNGCEVNINSDANNCGGCGSVCKLANATANCAGGICGVSSCNAGFQNCNNSAADGCEINSNTDPNNCGGCGHICNTPNGTPGCGSGLCTVASCNTGFANCNGNVADGCEVNTTTDNSNCGSCGNACLTVCGGSGKDVSGTQCTASKCGIIGCAAGFEDFNGTCSDGCECATSNEQTTCAAAQGLYAGVLPIGASINPVSYTMAGPPSQNQAWFTLTFSTDTGTAGPLGTGFNTSYAPTISLTGPTVGGVPEFVFDVYNGGCTNNLATAGTGCTDNGTNGSKQVTGWGTAWSGPKPPTSTAIATPGSGGQVWIKVYRNPAMPANEYSCGQYTLKASN